MPTHIKFYHRICRNLGLVRSVAGPPSEIRLNRSINFYDCLYPKFSDARGRTLPWNLISINEDFVGIYGDNFLIIGRLMIHSHNSRWSVDVFCKFIVRLPGGGLSETSFTMLFCIRFIRYSSLLEVRGGLEQIRRRANLNLCDDKDINPF